VCNFHRGEVSKPDSRWKWIHDVDGTRQLLLGFGQLVLNEYVVLEPPAEAIAYGKGHDVSHPEDNGIYFPIRVQRRGKEKPETITLVMSPDKMTAFATFLQMVTGTQSGG
jgi:hypothetical protein